jgi:protein-disulfide isomerase
MGRSSDGKRAARDRLAAQREAEQRRQRRRRQWIIVGSVVAVVAVAVGIGVAVQSSGGKPKPFVPVPGAVVDPFTRTADSLATAVPYGQAGAPVTMTVFEDFRCPVCRIFETGERSVYQAYVRAGKLRVLFHEVTLIDHNDGGSGSLRAGNAALCAQAAGHFQPYHDVLFDNQPDESDDAYADPDRLVELAKQVPGLDTPAFEACARGTTYEGVVQRNWNDFNALKLPGTPTVMLDGKQVPSQSLFAVRGNTEVANPTGLAAALEAAGAGGPPSPSAGSTAAGTP